MAEIVGKILKCDVSGCDSSVVISETHRYKDAVAQGNLTDMKNCDRFQKYPEGWGNVHTVQRFKQVTAEKGTFETFRDNVWVLMCPSCREKYLRRLSDVRDMFFRDDDCYPEGHAQSTTPIVKK